MTRKIFSLRSFEFAFDGLRSLIRTEPNARIHLVAGVVAIILGFLLRIKELEWLFLILAIAMVFATELFNSSIEKLADLIDPNFSPKIKLVKDLSAAGVLVSALASLAVGGIIFIPKLLALMK